MAQDRPGGENEAVVIRIKLAVQKQEMGGVRAD